MHIFVQTFILCFGRYIDEPICRNFEFKTASGMFNLHFKYYFCSLGLDTGDRQVLEQKYKGSDPPCLLDSSDGRWDWNLKQQTPSGNPTLDKCIKWARFNSQFICKFQGLVSNCYYFYSGSCWRGRAITRWMWWTVWWPGGDTRWWAHRSRGHCPTSTTRMTSEIRRQLKHVLYIDYLSG